MTFPAVTAITASVLSLFYIKLLLNVAKLRRSEKVGLGVGDSAVLLKAVRIHGNFSEYMPLSLIMLMLVELAGYPTYLSALFAVLLVVSRLLHFGGISKTQNYSRGRYFGTVLVVAHLVLCSCFLIGYAALQLLG